MDCPMDHQISPGPREQQHQQQAHYYQGATNLTTGQAFPPLLPQMEGPSYDIINPALFKDWDAHHLRQFIDMLEGVAHQKSSSKGHVGSLGESEKAGKYPATHHHQSADDVTMAEYYDDEFNPFVQKPGAEHGHDYSKGHPKDLLTMAPNEAPYPTMYPNGYNSGSLREETANTYDSFAIKHSHGCTENHPKQGFYNMSYDMSQGGDASGYNGFAMAEDVSYPFGTPAQVADGANGFPIAQDQSYVNNFLDPALRADVDVGNSGMGQNAARSKKRKTSGKKKTATKKDTPTEPIPCDKCGKLCKNKRTLRQHKLETHLGLKCYFPVGQDADVAVCGHTADVDHRLVAHTTEEHGHIQKKPDMPDGRFSCPWGKKTGKCGGNFSMAETANRCMRRHLTMAKDLHEAQTKAQPIPYLGCEKEG
ncbi:hypothetical protein MGN70_006414 [Eutypa lata]|nr:hypothetical protein MGN70_006414 [Eutypa lata]